MRRIERWRWVPGYRGVYRISHLGRIKRVGERKHCPKGAGKYLKFGRAGARRDYAFAQLMKDGVRKGFLVHRLVAIVFISPPPFPKAEVNHKDTDKLNNEMDNLEWRSRAGNVRDAIAKKLRDVVPWNKSARLRNSGFVL